MTNTWLEGGLDSELSDSSSPLSEQEGGERGSDFKMFSIEKGFIGFVVEESISAGVWHTCKQTNKLYVNIWNIFKTKLQLT